MQNEMRVHGDRPMIWARRGQEKDQHVFDADQATFSLPQKSLCGLPVQRVWQTKLIEANKCPVCRQKLTAMQG